MDATFERIDPGIIFHDDFRVVRRLSSGGMGAVYVVEQLSTGVQRALKVMKPELMHSADLRRRFELEARVASRIPSEHVVQVITAGIDAKTDMPFLVMELLSGADLADVVEKDGPFSLTRLQTVLEQLCHALGRAHAAGIVHRDLKPENIFLATSLRADETKTVKVLDFGIAKIVSEARTTETAAIGTPTWMAPEQTEHGGAISPATDVWALGLIAFTLLTGKPYWLAAQAGSSSSSVATLFRELLFEPLAFASERARALGAPAPPAGFDAWFARCVDRDPTRRFSDAAAAHAAFLRDVGADPSGITHFAADSQPSVLPRASGLTVVGTPVEIGQQTVAAAPLAPALGIAPAPALRKAPSRKSNSLTTVIAVLASMITLIGVTAGVRALLGRRDAPCTRGNGQDCLDRCDGGNRMACETLGQMYEQGDGVPKNLQEAVRVYRKACDGDYWRSCGALADLLRTGQFGTVENAFAPAEKACERLDARGCHALGVLYEKERVDLAKAELTLQKACDSKYAPSCSELGALAARSKRGSLARDLYAKGCELRDAEGCTALGLLYLRGTEVGQDLAAAERYFDQACRAGSARGCGLAGAVMFPIYESDGRAKQAIELLQKGCNADVYEAVSCERLGRLLELGYGISRDAKRAADLYRTVCGKADQAEPEQALACARASTREGVLALDERIGFRSIQTGCDDGDPWGCIEAGLRLEEGRGVAKDIERARKLFKQACGPADPVDPTSKIACARAAEREGAALLAGGDALAAETKFKAACDAGAGHGCLQIAKLRVSELQALNDKVPGTKPCDDACRREKVTSASGNYFAACDAVVPALEGCLLGAEWSGPRNVTEPTYRYEKLRRGCRLGDQPTCTFLDDHKIAR